MRKDDAIRVRHMLDAAREALSFAEGKSRRTLPSDRMLILALIKSIEIIGEAASTVTPETRQKYPGIPWRDIIAMRNRLIHVYFDIDLDRLWDTITDDLPKLIVDLEKVAVQGNGEK
ncbi:MAG: DUF86 domain-containing protein [Syntrophales bacterium]|nr:DUF86 domain-containing protein [Syntrophales bacterium]